MFDLTENGVTAQRFINLVSLEQHGDSDDGGSVCIHLLSPCMFSALSLENMLCLFAETDSS